MASVYAYRFKYVQLLLHFRNFTYTSAIMMKMWHMTPVYNDRNLQFTLYIERLSRVKLHMFVSLITCDLTNFSLYST